MCTEKGLDPTEMTEEQAVEIERQIDEDTYKHRGWCMEDPDHMYRQLDKYWDTVTWWNRWSPVQGQQMDPAPDEEEPVPTSAPAPPQQPQEEETTQVPPVAPTRQRQTGPMMKAPPPPDSDSDPQRNNQETSERLNATEAPGMATVPKP